MPRHWKYTLIIIIALAMRLAAQVPLVIDDDESWFSTSAVALSASGGPLAFYERAVDNKPPGTAWFYWLVEKLTHCGNDPRPARLAYLGLMALTAWILARYVRRISGSATAQSDRATKEGLFAAGLFLLAGAAVTPKLLAVTNEGLMLPWIAGAFLLVAGGDGALRLLTAGFCVGAAALIKQTALVFALPLALVLSGGPISSLALLGAGLVLPLALVIPALGLENYWYWTWVYPTRVLPQARGELFAGWGDLWQNVALFAVTLLPLVWAAGRKAFAGSIPFRGVEAGTRATIYWGLAAVFAICAGKGLFPHYFLLGLPPLCVLAAISLRRKRLATITLLSLAAGNCVLVALPGSGVFWGTDLPYHARLAERIRELTPKEEPVFVWGGSSLPLASAGRKSATSFVNARYLMPPYATDQAVQRFRAEFAEAEPKLVVDVHDRGDNQFNFPLERDAWLSARLARDYEPWVDPGLPWAVLYVKKGHPVASRALVRKPPGLRFDFGRDDIVRTTLGAWEKLAPEKGPELVSRLGVRLFVDLDPFLRTWYALHWYCAATDCLREKPDSRLRQLVERLDADTVRWNAQWRDLTSTSDLPETITVPEGYGYALEAEQLIVARGFERPFALEAPLWWPSYAVVNMQPVAVPRVSGE